MTTDIQGLLLKPHEALPIKPGEFIQVFELAMQAAEGQIPAPDPTSFSSAVAESDDPEADVLYITPTDHPLSRAAFKVLEHCQRDTAKYMSIMYRIHATANIIRSGNLAQWVLSDSDSGLLVHPAVLEAAATAPLAEGESITFLPDVFFARIQELATEHDRKP